MAWDCHIKSTGKMLTEDKIMAWKYHMKTTDKMLPKTISWC